MMLVALLACTPEPIRHDEPSASSLAPDLVAQTWQVRMADAAVRAPYEQHPGWALLFDRDFEGALRAFEAEPDDDGQARAHLELAALYRQAARVAAEATLQVYGEDRQPTDPADVEYLVQVSRRLLGRSAEITYVPEQPVLAARAAAFRAGALPGDTAITAADSDPGDRLRTYELPERTAAGKPMRVVDPSELYALSVWHDARARSLGARWRCLVPWLLPFEGAGDSELVQEAMVFGSFYATTGDVDFLAAACSGEPALDRNAQSILAKALQPAIVDGRLDVQKVREAAQGLEDALRSAMVARAGKEEGYQRSFADIGHLSVLRAAICVAEDLDQGEDAAVLRVEVADLSEGPARDPVFLLSLAAWDAAHRNAIRALDLVHTLSRDHPQLELARVPLDAMSVRLSRNSAPAAPGPLRKTLLRKWEQSWVPRCTHGEPPPRSHWSSSPPGPRSPTSRRRSRRRSTRSTPTRWSTTGRRS